jgi:hypothetical protein
MLDLSWNVAEPSLPAWTCTYSFGPGIASALAIAVEGGVAVVSPPAGATEKVFAAVQEHGAVRAIIAPNAFHHVGLPVWKARFPDVPVFAPAQSIARVEKHSKVTGIRPIAEAAKTIGDRVELVDMPHYKMGEVLVRWKIGAAGAETDGGWAWYVTDVLFNFPELPKGPFGWVMKWTKSAPGLRRNALAGTFAVKDKRSLYAWLASQAEATPPRVIIPCHGDVVTSGDPAATVRAALA